MRTMLWGIRGQRKATKEADHAKGNDTDAERQTNPLQNVGHLHPTIFYHFPGGWSRQRDDRFIVETLSLASI
jgi:hypothetical protein